MSATVLVADVEVAAWAICPSFDGFSQVKVHLAVTNTGEVPLPIGAGLGSPWRLLVGPPGRDLFPRPPRTPVPLSYELLDLDAGALVGVPPNPPNQIVYADKRDFATRHWPESEDLSPDSEYYVEPVKEERVGGSVYRGSTLVFNVPPDESLELYGLALVVDGSVVVVEAFEHWPREPSAANDF